MDEQEGVSSVTSVSEPTVGATAHEGDEEQADEPYNEGDGGEIMVEVVGSDVFVDGVCGDGGELGHEGFGKLDTVDEHRDFRSGEAGQEDCGNTGNGVEGELEVAGSSRDVVAGTEIVPGVPSVTACSVVEKVNPTVTEEDVEDNVVRSTESARADLATLDVAGPSRGVSETVDNESGPRSPNETAETVLQQVSTRVTEEAEGNVTVSVEGSVELTSQRPGLSDDGVWNPGIEPLVESSSFVPQHNLNLESEAASNLRLDSSEKDESTVREIIGQDSEKEIPNHARNQISDHPDEGAVSGDSGVVRKSCPEVETMETDTHDQERVALGNNDVNSHQDSGMVQKDATSVKEIVGQASEKDISSHARDQMPEHPAAGTVAGDSGVVQKTHSEVETMEGKVHDQERDALGDKNENTHSKVEPMETDDPEQRDDLGHKDEDSHQGSGLVQKNQLETETMETNVHGKETIGLGNQDENSRPDVEPMETDVYDQDGGLLDKDKNNHGDDEIINMCHQVPAGHDNLGVDIPASQDSASSYADEMASSRPNSQIPEDRAGEIEEGSGGSRISAEHTPVADDHSLGTNRDNVQSHPEKQEHSFKGNLAAGNGVIGSSCEKANHAEDRELKVDNMHDDKTNFAVCTQAETSDMEIQTSNHKEVSLEGSEISSCKVPISSDNESLGGSDKLPDVQPKVADLVSEVTRDDFPLPVQTSARDTGNLDEMEVEGVHHETTGTLTFSINDESLNIVEVDTRLKNDARIGPLETPYEPACRSNGASVEMDKDEDAQHGTTTARVSCTMGKNILRDETRVSLDTMISTRDMNSEDETKKVTHFLPEGLDVDMSLQRVENESLLGFDNFAGKEDDPQMSAVSSNDDAMMEIPERTSLACQSTSKTSDSNAVYVKSPSLLKENDFEVEAEHKVEDKDTVLREDPDQGDDLAHDTKKGAVTAGIHSHIIEESESSVNQEGVVEHVNMLAIEINLDAGNAATADKILNEENNSNLEGAIKSQTAINSGADVPPPVRDQIVETCISNTSNAMMNQVDEDQDSFKATGDFIFYVEAPEMKVTGEQEKGQVEKLDAGTVQESPEQDKKTEEVAPETRHTPMLNEKPVSLLNMHPGYLIPPENEGEYSISDLVWGKVRSHPWWPGQIFDPSDASEKAIKYHKKDSFLVAYFGDRTFAWNDASVLRPFCSHFSQIEKQSNSETFQNAISCALEEVSRRVELGLACSCIPEDSYDEISCQIVENTGIREESSKRYRVDKSTGITSFLPDRLVHYMKALALSPTCRANRLDLTISRAQLVAFCHFKGYRLPPQFLLSGDLLEDEADIPHVDSAVEDNGHASESSEQHPTNKVSAHKRKHSSQNKMKERSLSELMDNMECEYSPDGEDDSDEKIFTSRKKKKAVDSCTDGYDRKTSVYAAKVSNTVSISPKPSFRIGECIQRVASQLTRSASHLKCNSDQSGAAVQLQDSPKGKVVVPTELPSPKELLSQLQLVAGAPLKGYNFLKTITTFFSGFRNSVAVGQNSRRQNLLAGKAAGGRKKRASQTVAGFAEEFEFDDVNDSYWTDRVVQNCGEEQPLQNSHSGEHQLVAQDSEKSNKSGRRSYTRKRKSGADFDVTPGVPPEDIEKRKHEPAELILIFAEGSPLPSEMNLNKMFRRFGPLKELETEVHQESSRARVVFKRGSDAEVAHSSVGKFNIFGSRQVTYELSYTPVISFKPMLLTVTPDLEGELFDATAPK